MSLISKINWSLVLGISAGIIAMFAAIVQWNEKKKQEDIANESKAEAKQANDQLLKLTTENLDSTKELANAYKKIAMLQDELLNQFTGGDNIPILQLNVVNISKPSYDERFNGYYYIVFIDISNDGEYPLHNVKTIVTDMWGRDMSKYVRYERNGMGQLLDTRPKLMDSNNDYEPINSHEFSVIPIKTHFPVYSTTISPQLCSIKTPGYQIQLFWGNGSLTYFINCLFKENGFYLHDVEFILNGNKTADYHKYLKINLPQSK